MKGESYKDQQRECLKYLRPKFCTSSLFLDVFVCLSVWVAKILTCTVQHDEIIVKVNIKANGCIDFPRQDVFWMDSVNGLNPLYSTFLFDYLSHPPPFLLPAHLPPPSPPTTSQPSSQPNSQLPAFLPAPSPPPSSQPTSQAYKSTNCLRNSMENSLAP